MKKTNDLGDQAVGLKLWDVMALDRGLDRALNDV
jgi:hypothetical protein